MGDARCAQLREVVEDLYADRIEPSLPEAPTVFLLKGEEGGGGGGGREGKGGGTAVWVEG